MLPSDLNERIKESDNKQDDANLDNVRVLAFKGKKVAVITATAAKCIVGSLFMTPIHMVLEKKGRDGQDISVREV